jgi:histidinol-phosphatase (PHP family)
MIPTSYHNHTKWSDGSGTVREMIEAARAAGLQEIGISDHFAFGPGKPVSWALDPKSLGSYVEDVESARNDNSDIAVRLSLEVDYFPETIDQIRAHLASYKFDYLIGSVHFIDAFPVDFGAQPWQEVSQEMRNELWHSYWQLLRATAQCGMFDIIGHFDLPKKFNFYPSLDLTADALSVLDAMAEADVAIEINTSGWDRPVGEAYPCLRYLQEANRRKIPLVINADGHAPGEITRYFDRASELARAAGYKELARFEQHRRLCHRF